MLHLKALGTLYLPYHTVNSRSSLYQGGVLIMNCILFARRKLGLSCHLYLKTLWLISQVKQCLPVYCILQSSLYIVYTLCCFQAAHLCISMIIVFLPWIFPMVFVNSYTHLHDSLMIA